MNKQQRRVSTTQLKAALNKYFFGASHYEQKGIYTVDLEDVLVLQLKGGRWRWPDVNKLERTVAMHLKTLFMNDALTIELSEYSHDAYTGFALTIYWEVRQMTKQVFKQGDEVVFIPYPGKTIKARVIHVYDDVQPPSLLIANDIGCFTALQMDTTLVSRPEVNPFEEQFKKNKAKWVQYCLDPQDTKPLPPQGRD